MDFLGNITVTEIGKNGLEEGKYQGQGNAWKAFRAAQERCAKNLNFNSKFEGRIKMTCKRLMEKQEEIFSSFLI